jgi:hypothetical protein
VHQVFGRLEPGAGEVLVCQPEGSDVVGLHRVLRSLQINTRRLTTVCQEAFKKSSFTKGFTQRRKGGAQRPQRKGAPLCVSLRFSCSLFSSVFSAPSAVHTFPLRFFAPLRETSSPLRSAKRKHGIIFVHFPLNLVINQHYAMTTKPEKPAPKPTLRKLGALKGKIYIAPDAFTPDETREPGYLDKTRSKQ